jgi:hypothetical protein
MKRPTLNLTALTLAAFLATLASDRAQDAPTAPPPPPIISTTANQTYPQVTCTSSDPLACADALQLASDTRDQLAPILKLRPEWRFAVHIHIMTPDDPLLAKINREASAVFSQGNTMKIEAVLPSSSTNPREFIQRQFVTAILWEKFFANRSTFDKKTPLDLVPMWLVEGLREWLNEDPEHTRESIVSRAVKNGTAPTLDQVTGWRELSNDRLLGIWQRAFCYYLVDILVQEGPQRDDFQQWLSGPDPSPFQSHFPTENAWQLELAAAAQRSHDIVYTWSETAEALTDAETITFATSKDAQVQTCALDAAATLPRIPPVLDALDQRILILTQLESRAHPSWHNILELYRAALTALGRDNRPDLAAKLLQEAHRQRVTETAYHQKLFDYVNWFEVTKDDSDSTTHFKSYFSTAKEMDRIQADPAHPNPIRADLLQIESEL